MTTLTAANTVPALTDFGATSAAAAGGSSLLSTVGAALGPIGLGLSVVGAIAGLAGSAKAKKQQKKARREAIRLQRLQAAEQRRERVRQAIIANSVMRNTAAQTGTTGSSGVLGGSASVASQVGSAVAFSQFTEGLSLKIGAAEQKAANAEYLSRVGSDLFQIGKGLYNWS